MNHLGVMVMACNAITKLPGVMEPRF